MKVGLIGLGKMGFNLALNLLDHRHELVVYDVDRNSLEKISKHRVIVASSIKELVGLLAPRRVVWLMVPAGKIVDDCIDELQKYFFPNDIIIDGGNSNYKQSISRAEKLKIKKISFIDCGTSGGMAGARHGACTMVGGNDDDVDYCSQIFKDISVENGFLHVGPAGSGHFVKMVHNGIEYGMMQAIAEGFSLMEKSPFKINHQEAARVWNNGSVIRGWLMELTESAFKKDKDLSSIKGIMHASGEGQWTVETALELGVPVPVIALSLMMRQRSLEEDSFSGKVVAALRNEFGGHRVERK